VLSFVCSSPPGEEAMGIGLRLHDAFDLGAAKWLLPAEFKLDQLSDEPRDYELSTDDVTSLCYVLTRPGQVPAMWICSARALRRIREAAEPKALTSVP
jgi:hypothetical protein